jgi:3',5'-cyclic AMP phosphodiesterase CpdA
VIDDPSWRRRRARQRRNRHVKYAVLALASVLVLGLAVWAAFQVNPSDPADADPIPLPPPVVATSDVPPPSDPTTAPTTDPTQPVVRLAVLGDAGTREAMQMRVASQVAAADRVGRPFDALLITGDLIYEEGDSDLTDASVVRPYASTFTRAEIIAALGNHDVDSGEGSDIMRRLGRNGPVYVQKVGPVTVISLDSNDVDSRQSEWLDRVLAQERPTSPWVVTVMHHPAYSSGSHGSEASVRERWVPLFRKHRVNLVLAGHDHNYERTKPQGGVTYIVSGGGGADLRKVGRSDFTATSASKHHFVDLNVFADRIEGRAIDRDGAVFDTFTIPRG